jgi:hypothetical protein
MTTTASPIPALLPVRRFARPTFPPVSKDEANRTIAQGRVARAQRAADAYRSRMAA